MVLPALSLAATLWAVVTPAEQAKPAPVASTYDQATCAALHAAEDDWSTAAIGELTPAQEDAGCSQPVPVTPLSAVECETLLPWIGQGTCAVPRGNAPSVRTERDRRRVLPLLLELTATDTSTPLAPPRAMPEHAPLSLRALPILFAPDTHALSTHWSSPTLRSITSDVLLRPPQA
jgi:hypothetical protein